MKSFLQTKEWLEFQKEVGHKTWRFSNGPTSLGSFEGQGKITANIIKLGLPLGKSFLYIPHGPEIDFNKIQSGLKNELANFVKYLKDLAKAEKAIFIKIEPFSDVVIELLHVKGMRRSSKQIQPYKTVVLDLSLPEEHLLGKMHAKTRYNIKVAENNGIVVKDSNDLDTFWKLLGKTTKRDRFASHPKVYYKKLLEHFPAEGGSASGGNDMKVDLVMAYLPAGQEGHNDRAVAGAILMTYGDTCYYLYGASDYEYRSVMAPYALHWENIKYLKGRGIKYYDFWGIDAQKWPGVTRFKLGWLGSPKSDEGGGGLKEYPGSFDLVTSKFWYFVYNIARKVF